MHFVYPPKFCITIVFDFSWLCKIWGVTRFIMVYVKMTNTWKGLVPFDWTCFCVVKWLKSTATRCKKKKLWCSESSTCRKTLKLNLLISHYVHFHLYGIYTVCFSFAFAVVVKLTVDFLRSVQSCRIRILSNLQNGIASLLLLLPPFCAL